MKKNLTLLALLLGFAAAAQPDRFNREQQRERIEAAKIGYLTNALNLSVEESQKFWPVYNELQNKEMELRESTRSKLEELGKLDENTSEKALEKLLLDVGQTHVQVEQLRLDYLDDFIQVIGARKTAQLLRAEREFGRKMMERMQERGSEGRGPARDLDRRRERGPQAPFAPRP